MPDAIVLVDKPQGWTSHDVVARGRRIFATRRVGHAGTLDPMATGLLILGVDRGTKLLTYLVGLDKVYQTTIRLGQATVTDDAEGEITEQADAETLHTVTEARIREIVETQLSGDIDQVPSSVSAIKIDGVRSYARVRAGEGVELSPRPITIHEFAVTDVRRRDDGFVDVDARVHCSSGTYIRALARDLGTALGVGGHLTALRRVRVGPFDVADASVLPGREVPIEQVETPPALTLGQAASAVLPTRVLSAQECVDLGHGRPLAPSAEPAAGPQPISASAARHPSTARPLTAALDDAGGLRGIVENRGGRARAVLVVPPDANAPQPADSQREGRDR
ncbi:tRNA pseudouridine(55) synthase TruB [Pseudoclavibacter sp. 13-3]|uniref:tRNA pseudouridine(55) synthase TruB n=1 Tax=Pseudoclavibacter sp. 13-3 TaxID=2901228 RepID=UPI001E635AA7|nr:tRNA pseudouridine(55) synthase TruB [Pseudoclavibacter sp. 13-3]MCD7101003.1 tRNA pseudouridine(55) synthase TruB [Pseudoclavibacter sp. 13-3]